MKGQFCKTPGEKLGPAGVVHQSIRDAIVNGHVAPCTRLNQLGLTREFDVSEGDPAASSSHTHARNEKQGSA